MNCETDVRGPRVEAQNPVDKKRAACPVPGISDSFARQEINYCLVSATSIHFFEQYASESGARGARDDSGGQPGVGGADRQATRERAPGQSASKCRNEGMCLMHLKDKWEITSA